MPLSYAFKFVHVSLELANLIVVFLVWHWTWHATATAIVAWVSLLASLTMPCDVAYQLTGVGAVLDTLNFVLCATVLFGGRVVDNAAALRLVTLSFLFHATYIWTFLLMTYGVDDLFGRVVLRLYGVVANAAAIHVAVSAIDAYRPDHDEQEKVHGVRREQRDSALISHRTRRQYCVFEEGCEFRPRGARGH